MQAGERAVNGGKDEGGGVRGEEDGGRRTKEGGTWRGGERCLWLDLQRRMKESVWEVSRYMQGLVEGIYN